MWLCSGKIHGCSTISRQSLSSYDSHLFSRKHRHQHICNFGVLVWNRTSPKFANFLFARSGPSKCQIHFATNRSSWAFQRKMLICWAWCISARKQNYQRHHNESTIRELGLLSKSLIAGTRWQVLFSSPAAPRRGWRRGRTTKYIRKGYWQFIHANQP